MVVILALSTSLWLYFCKLSSEVCTEMKQLTQLMGCNPLLFITKHQAVTNHMRLQAYRPYKHDQCSNRVREYRSYFKTSIIQANISLLSSAEKLQMLHERRNRCYTNHCYITTIQL